MDGRCSLVNRRPNKSAWKYIPHLRRTRPREDVNSQIQCLDINCTPYCKIFFLMQRSPESST